MCLIKAPSAWANGDTGEGVTVAVIDSGADYTHPDLISNLLPGVNYVTPGASAQDDYGHGTHVAGIIGAAVNHIGLVGVAPSVKILPLKILDNTGSGYESDLISALAYAETRAQVVNLSLGSQSSLSTDLKSALDEAINTHHVLIVAAAGNDALNGNPTIYPAAYPPVLSVAAVDYASTVAAFSTHNNNVDVSAPGVDILSDYPNTMRGYLTDAAGNSYTFMDGTSMAAPHVSGAVALILSQHPGYSPAQVTSLLESTALDLGEPGKDPYYGYGLIQLGAATTAAASLSAQSFTPQSGDLSAYAVHDDRSAAIAPGRVLARFSPDLSAADRASLLTQAGNLEFLEEIPTGGGIQVLQTQAGSEWQTIDWLRAQPGVLSADPDYVISIQ